MSRLGAALLSILFFPFGLIALAFVESGPEPETCDACEGEHHDCPHCGGF